jgi:hypothetical protein
MEYFFPLARKLYVPTAETDSGSSYIRENIPEIDQTHRSLTWLFHRPQSIADNFIQSVSGRKEK